MKTTSHNPRQTAFMAVCFFTHKPNGFPFSQAEIFNKENRKQFDSYDFTYGIGGKLIRDESTGLSKLRKMVTQQYRGKCYGGYILAVKRDVKLYTFGKDSNLKELNTPNFFRDTEKNEVVLQNITPVTLFQPKAQQNFIPPNTNNYQSLGQKMRSIIGTNNI